MNIRLLNKNINDSVNNIMNELYKNTKGLSNKYLKPSINDLLLKISIAKFKNNDVNTQIAIEALVLFFLKIFILKPPTNIYKIFYLLKKVNILNDILALF